MKMKNKVDALKLALEYVGLEEKNICNMSLRREGNFVIVSFRSLWLAYELYVDCENGAVPGIDIRPCPGDWDTAQEKLKLTAKMRRICSL